MGEFLAWAAAGVVTGLQTWSVPGSAGYAGGRDRRPQSVRSARESYRQRFLLRQRDGRTVEVLLIDSGIPFQNGHAVTAVWAARAKAPYGHCIYLENHTNGAFARLSENVRLIRKPAPFWKPLLVGLIATFPAALALLSWPIYRHGLAYIHERTFVVSAGAAITIIFVISVVVSKLVFDYLRAEDEQKIWHAADRALLSARRVLIEKPMPRRFPK
jgi:hypothetical protein